MAEVTKFLANWEILPDIIFGFYNYQPNRIWSPDRPARSQSLYRLSYPALNSEYLILRKKNCDKNATRCCVIHTLPVLLAKMLRAISCANYTYLCSDLNQQSRLP
jgi:hypothetical protein